jgi:hypothetical protein
MLRSLERRSRVKEASEIKVPTLPAGNQYRAWKHAVYSNINAASGRSDDKALTWARECEDKSKTVDDFIEGPKQFAMLDRKPFIQPD